MNDHADRPKLGPKPSSPEAIANGCKCDALARDGEDAIAKPNHDCPVHGIEAVKRFIERTVQYYKSQRKEES